MLHSRTRTPGGVRELFYVSAPIVISQASESLMLLTDRYFLTPLGKEYPSASMSGGLTSLLALMFFIGLLSYSNALVAQYLGADQKHNCAVVLTQCVLLSLSAYPCVLLGGKYLAPLYFEWTGAHATEIALALSYFQILNIAAIFVLFNIAFAGYFAGIGRAMVVMWVTLLAVFANAPLSYYFIHHGIAGRFDGIQGAALGIAVAQLLSSLLYLSVYIRHYNRSRFAVRQSLHFDATIARKLLRYGSPAGAEFFLHFFAFSSFVAIFHSYGPNEALAITIALNWDIVAFMPLSGLNIGLMSLVGRHLGARRIDLAMQTTYSGIHLALIVSAFFFVIFYLGTDSLIALFMPANAGVEREVIGGLAHLMLRSIGIYAFANSVIMVFLAVLRAAGDTQWCMWLSLTAQWGMLAVTYLAIRVFHARPEVSWGLFVCSIFFLAAAYTARFLHGRWQTIVVV